MLTSGFTLGDSILLTLPEETQNIDSANQNKRIPVLCENNQLFLSFMTKLHSWINIPHEVSPCEWING
jgi:hypothetical protein